MRKYAAFSFSVAVILLAALAACDKATLYNGNVYIAILYKKNPQKGFKVYYKKGVPEKDNKETLLSDGMQTTNEAGTVTFYQLTPGSYTFYTFGYLPEAGRVVSRDTNLVIRARYRDESNYRFDLTLN
ncbi:hypothetical protein IDJ75_04975 [Mucilaginibacter rigui]|uniref:Uncharacterized protein n=1 Tax=Mucilaginibacter rigui TaxID=534635 RepID=A0ABR7X205_9SPHI|nr:prealbumin-like fold domain-containing protein [Mucilaginibacter rigui]MBD1384623.1 hypothetical protein [Mucilaginibacter rigui]